MLGLFNIQWSNKSRPKHLLKADFKKTENEEDMHGNLETLFVLLCLKVFSDFLIIIIIIFELENQDRSGFVISRVKVLNTEQTRILLC